MPAICRDKGREGRVAARDGWLGPARRNDGQPRVIAIMRYVNPRLQGRLKHRDLVPALDLAIVDDDLRHAASLPRPWPKAPAHDHTKADFVKNITKSRAILVQESSPRDTGESIENPAQDSKRARPSPAHVA